MTDLNKISLSTLVDYTYHIFAMTGELTAGKSTLARTMQLLLTPFWNVQILSFARDVKRIAHSFGWDGQKDDKGRKLLQLIGTEVGRAYMPDLWIRYLLLEGSVSLNKDDKYKNIIIIDDLRFDNEAQWLKEYHAGTIIKVTDGITNRKHTDHISEKGIDPKYINYVVDDSKNIFSTFEQAYDILNDMKFKTLQGTK